MHSLGLCSAWFLKITVVSYYTATNARGESRWQGYPFGHIPFEPVDNLGYYGWSRFRNGDYTYENLGYPLHALGDATVPMHVTGTTSWGHRPFEDAQELLWPQILDALETPESLAAIFERAFRYRQEIRQWRADRGNLDIPVRHLIRAVARRTYDYSFQVYQPGPTGWPFNDPASALYLASKSDATAIYELRPDAVPLVTPLFIDGIAAKIAFLTSAGELPGVAPAGPARAPALAPGLRLASGLRPGESQIQLTASSIPPTTPPTTTPSTTTPPTSSSPTAPPSGSGADPFLQAIDQDYTRLAALLTTGKLTPAQYLVLVRDRSRKAERARTDPAWAQEWAHGDDDHDFVPNSRDHCAHTPDLTPTDDQGCPVRVNLPQVASADDLKKVLDRIKIALCPGCATAPEPRAPQPLKAGYIDSFQSGIFALALSKVDNVPAGCPVFYDISLRYTNFFSRPTTPRRHLHLVFRDSDNTDVGPSGRVRRVFRIRTRNVGFFPVFGGTASKFEWRARAITGGGQGSNWSSWVVSSLAPFGEP